VPGWTPSGQPRVFDPENLYDLVNGQADAYLAYGFHQVGVQDYEHNDGAPVRIQVWQLDSSDDAFGLYSSHRSGEPAGVGNEGDIDPGRRLHFWQDRFFVRLVAPQAAPDGELQSLARAVAGSLPAGGEQPSLLARLPQEGLKERSTIFFRNEMSIQNYLWLGGENLLRLGPETGGVLARYDLGEQPAIMVLVQYPDAGSASAAQKALEAGNVEGFVAAARQDNLMAAVFGSLDIDSAQGLMQDALNEE
jgi:hypothetical protein